LEHELTISDKIILPVDSFTYVSDTHGTCSWLDHVVSSKSAPDSIQNIEILQQSHSLWTQACSCNHKNCSNTPKPTLW